MPQGQSDQLHPVHAHQSQELPCSEEEDRARVRDTLLRQAEIAHVQDDEDEALRLYAEVTWLCLEHEDAESLPIILSCQSKILAMLARLDEVGRLRPLGDRLVAEVEAHSRLMYCWSHYAEVLVTERGFVSDGRVLAEGLYQFVLRYKYPPLIEKVAQFVRDLKGGDLTIPHRIPAHPAWVNRLISASD